MQCSIRESHATGALFVEEQWRTMMMLMTVMMMMMMSMMMITVMAMMVDDVMMTMVERNIKEPLVIQMC